MFSAPVVLASKSRSRVELGSAESGRVPTSASPAFSISRSANRSSISDHAASFSNADRISSSCSRLRRSTCAVRFLRGPWGAGGQLPGNRAGRTEAGRSVRTVHRAGGGGMLSREQPTGWRAGGRGAPEGGVRGGSSGPEPKGAWDRAFGELLHPLGELLREQVLRRRPRRGPRPPCRPWPAPAPRSQRCRPHAPLRCHGSPPLLPPRPLAPQPPFAPPRARGAPAGAAPPPSPRRPPPPRPPSPTPPLCQGPLTPGGPPLLPFSGRLGGAHGGRRGPGGRGLREFSQASREKSRHLALVLGSGWKRKPLRSRQT